MAALLEGIRVVDFTQALSGPTLTRYLAELGAEVVKIEQPGGDITRLSATVRDGRSGYFASVNRNKRSLCVDLHDPRGVALVDRLVAGADVVAENFRPGTIARLGFSWERLSALNPRLILCSISAFGQEGPLAGLAGYDGVAQAYSGVTSLNGLPGGEPSMAGAALGDVLTGVNAVAAVLGALYHRERTGAGQRVEVSLLLSYMQAHDMSIQSFSLTDGAVVQTRSGRFHPLACPYGIFACRDGYLFVCAAADRHWRDLCAAMDRPELADAGGGHPWAVRSSRERCKDEVNAFIEAWLDTLASRDAALALLQRHRVPVGPVFSIDEVVRSPELRAAGAVRTASDPVFGSFEAPGAPLRFSGVDEVPDGEAPFLGEHNEEVARGWADLSTEEYGELCTAGVLRAEPVAPRPSRRAE
ncbi:MAG: CaiB/BaiF CoA transferase family protein [Acidimicrobiia bacterium]